MEARAVRTPSTSTVHWLRATRGRAGLIVVAVWASITVVSSNCADGVSSALFVCMLLRVIKTLSIVSPISNTINWLAASCLCALFILVSMRTLFSILLGFYSNDILPAFETFVAIFLILAWAVGSPLALAINWLTATTLRALLQHIQVWASITNIHGHLAHTVHAATLVFMPISNIVTSVVGTPRANTVNRLSTAIVGTLLKVVGVRTCISVVGWLYNDAIISTFLVAVILCVMPAE